MVVKKKYHLLLLVFLPMFFVGLFGNMSEIYAGYNRGTTITSDDVKTIMQAVGMSVPSNTRVNNYRDTINGLINNLYSTYSDFRLENMVFYYYNNSLYVVLQNGSVGNSFDYLFIHYVKDTPTTGDSTMGRYVSTIYSGEQIIGFYTDQLQTFYKITETSYTTDSYTYPSFPYTSVPFESGDKTIHISQICPLWNYDSVASFIGPSGINNETADWRFLGNSVQLSGWVAPTSTPTPTPTSTPTPISAGGGGPDLTDTNNKIDQTNESINNLTNQISGDHQELMESLTDVPSGDDFEYFSSGDIINALNLPNYTDPFTSLWGELISGLSTALTCTELEYITINFLGYNYRLHVIEVDYGEEMNEMLEKIMLVLPILAVIIVWRRIYLDIMSGNFMKVADYFSSFDWSQYF